MRWNEKVDVSRDTELSADEAVTLEVAIWWIEGGQSRKMHVGFNRGLPVHAQVVAD